jgi:hypothetical protein
MSVSTASPQRRRILAGLGESQPRNQEAGEKDKAFRGGNKPEWLIHDWAQPRGQVGECHPDQEETAQRVQLWTALSRHSHCGPLVVRRSRFAQSPRLGSGAALAFGLFHESPHRDPLPLLYRRTTLGSPRNGLEQSRYL